MKRKDKFIAGIKAGYKATFHKGEILGKMGYLHDELEIVGNAINYFENLDSRIRLIRTNHQTCTLGIEYFFEKKYKEAFEQFKLIPDDLIGERNYLLAICYLYGKGVSKNKNMGFKLAKEGAALSLCCKELLARCYIEGIGAPVSKKKAYDLLIEVLESVKKNVENDLDEDYLMPDIIYFCGEYEMENEDTENALEHLKMAALDKNYGLAYYMLGKYYYPNEAEKAKRYFDKAKSLNVNVSSKYYADERGEIADTPIEFNVGDKINMISNCLNDVVNIKQSVEELDPEVIIKTHNKAKVERINSEAEVKALRISIDDNIETKRLESETQRIEAESKKEKATKKNTRWKKRNGTESKQEKTKKKNAIWKKQNGTETESKKEKVKKKNAIWKK